MEKPEAVYLRSEFGVEECLRRLREATDVPKWEFFFPFGHGGSKPYFGKFRGNRVKLWKRKQAKNDFAPCFDGVMSPEGSGARLVGRFRMHRSVRLLMTFWLIFSVGIVFVTLPELVEHLSHLRQCDVSAFDFMPLGIAIFGFLLFRYGRRIGKKDESFLLEFLQTTLQVRQEDSRFLIPNRATENKPL
jgi:hypothetical protein